MESGVKEGEKKKATEIRVPDSMYREKTIGIDRSVKKKKRFLNLRD